MKRVFLVSMMLLAVLGISAQGIVGKWKSETIKQDGMDCNVIFNFAEGTTCDVLMYVSLVKDDINMSAHITVPGTYTFSGNQLTMHMQKDKVGFELDDLTFSGKAAEKLKENPQMEGMIRNIMVQALESNKDKMVESIPFDSSTTKLNLEENKLEIDGFVFHRVNE